MHRNLLVIAFAIVLAGLVAGAPFLFVDLGAGTDIQDRFSIIAAILTAVALILGALSFVVLMSVESSDFKALQTFKSDLAGLMMALNSVILDEALASGMRRTPSDLSHEQNVVRKFLSSTSGFGLTALVRKKAEAAGRTPSEWRLLVTYLWEVSSGTNRADIASASAKATRILHELDAKDLEHVGRFLSDMHRGIVAHKDYQKGELLLWQGIELLGAQSDPGESTGKLRALKAAGVVDPDVDLFLAVDAGDTVALQAALDAGGNPSVTDTQILRRHKAKLTELGLA